MKVLGVVIAKRMAARSERRGQVAKLAVIGSLCCALGSGTLALAYRGETFAEALSEPALVLPAAIALMGIGLVVYAAARR